MDLTSLEWQMIDLNEWVFGLKVRGMVRDRLGEVYFDGDKDPGWIWFTKNGGPRGACNTLGAAVNAVESVLSSEGK